MSNERALKKAVHHVLRRMQNDGRVAWLLGPGSEAYDQLTAAFAAADGQELEKFRSLYEPTLKPEPWPSADRLSGETIQQRDAVCEAWSALPDDLRKDQRLTRLYHAQGGPRMDDPTEASLGVPATSEPDYPYPRVLAQALLVDDWLRNGGKVPEAIAREFTRVLREAQASPPGGVEGTSK